MGIPGSANLLLAAAEAEPYQISQSLRFRDAQYLQRTIGSASSSTWTLSFWLKQTKPFEISSDGDSYFYDSTGTNLYVNNNSSAGSDRYKIVDTNASGTRKAAGMTRDPGAWYHLVYWCDGSDNRLYVNGSLTSGWSVSGSSTHNGTTAIGRYRSATNSSGATYLNGYLAEFHFVDGTALVPDGNFGEYDSSNVWRPIEYTGSHGTQGWYLKFDPDATNGIGHDHSANSNNFTATGFTTSGTGTDVMNDTPTKNWCTGNPLATNPGNNIWSSNGGGDGNLSAYLDNTRAGIATIPFPNTGKWYCEVTVTSLSGTAHIGISDIDNNDWVNDGSEFFNSTFGGYAYISSGSKVASGSSSSYGASWLTNDIIGVAFDATNGTLVFYRNGATQGTAFTSISTSQNWILAFRGASSATFRVKLNFGQREFAHPPGTASFTDHFAVVTYTGTSATQSITGVGFQPDFVWIKHRNGTGNHNLFDSVRGTGKQLYSNLADGEGDFATSGLTAFGTDGFTLGNSANSDANISSNTYVAWCWKAGGTASSNTDGTITASVSANQTAGFSVATYTGTGANASFGHGLGAVPAMCIVKSRDATQSWWVWHKAFGNNVDANNNMIELNGSGGKYPGDDVFRGFTSTVVNIGADTGSNTSGDDYVAYTFAEKSGYTKIDSYTGNGLAAGPEVDLGFRPAFLLVKADASADWQMFDSQRRSDDGMLLLRANYTPGGETDPGTLVFTNNGFRIISSDADVNGSGTTYLYLALSESFVSGDYKELNTANLPAPDIKNGADYFNTVLYTGSGGTQSVTGVGFQSDLVWMKRRSGDYSHALCDVVRGTAQDTTLASNTTDNEAANSNGYVSSFDSDGFTVAGGSSISNPNQATNQSGETYVAWNWLAGGSGSSNTAGTITSTVSASPSSGFSIVSWTGDGSASATVGHGLGVVPALVIAKSRDSAEAWMVKHKDLASNYVLELAATNAASDATGFSNGSLGNLTSNTTFGFVSGSSGIDSINKSGEDIIAYCFAEVESYSRIGVYTGNGSTDGPYITTSFTPSWVMLKRSDSSGTDWIIQDAARSTYNVVDDILRANTNQAEASGNSNYYIDFLSNGIKLRTSSAAWNASGGTYVFACFASNPFGGDGVSPATAR